MLAWLCLALVLEPSGPASAESPTNGRSFSAAERARLHRGELIQRPASKQHGTTRLVGGTSYQVIEAPPSVVWEALVDTRFYPRMMPRVLEATVVEQSAGKRKVFMRQGQRGLLETSYFLDVSLDRVAGDIRFRLDDQRPHDLRAAWGFYNLRAYGKRQTLLSYGIMADLGDGLLTSLLRNTVRDWMLKTPWMVKRFVEGSGRWLYDWRPGETRS